MRAPPIHDPGSRWKTIVAGVVLVLAICIVYGRTCTFDFTLWDDPQNVSQNPLLNPPGLAHMGEFWCRPYENLYIPVTYSLWSALASLAWLEQPDAQQNHLNPYLFHCFNLLLHVLCALAVWGLVRRLVKNEWAALAGAMVFALHPLQVETVAWISGARDLLAVLFALLAATCFLRAMQSRERPARVGFHLLGVLLFTLAILCKPTVVELPLIVLVLARWEKLHWRIGDIAAIGGWSLLALAGEVMTRAIQTGAVAGPPPPLWLRPFVALDAIAFYVWKLVVPLGLGIDYGRSPAWLHNSGLWKVTWLLPAGIIVALLLVRAPSRIWLAACVLVIALLPVLGLVTFNFQFYSTVADHYMFLPMLGIALVIGQIVSAATQRSRRVAPIIVAVAVAVLSAISFIQSDHWRTSRDLFSRAIQVNPLSFVSHYDLGVLDEREQRPDQAIEQFRAAIAVRPDYVPARSELGALLLRMGQIDEGLSQLSQSLRITQQQEPNIDLTEAYVVIAHVAQKAGRLAQARLLAKEAANRYSQNPSVRQLLQELGTSGP
jgi:Tfp pilus assembly protein PilF